MVGTRIILSQSRDLPLLDFLWRWKLSTTSALAARFFPACSLARAYNRLRDLERAGYLECVCDRTGKQFVWTLGKKGFGVVRGRLPALREEGYKSEFVDHDLLVTAVHLGEFLTGAENGVEVFTEQQLRRLHFDMFPAWAPRSDVHRADGYWKIPSATSDMVLALEVELSVKSRHDYELTADFYGRQAGISRVIWVVESATSAHFIDQALNHEASADAKKKHNFVLLDQVRKAGWQTPFVFGPECGKNLRSLLCNNPVTSQSHVTAMLLFDTRKSPHRSKSYAKICAPSISD